MEFVFSTVFFIAWPSQCPTGRRRPGEFVEDGSPVVDPSGRVRAVLPALADGQEEDLHSRVDVRERAIFIDKERTQLSQDNAADRAWRLDR